MKRALTQMVLAMGLLIICVVGGGCRTVDSETENIDTKPWNTPAGWEGQLMGVPYW